MRPAEFSELGVLGCSVWLWMLFSSGVLVQPPKRLEMPWAVATYLFVDRL